MRIQTFAIDFFQWSSGDAGICYILDAPVGGVVAAHLKTFFFVPPGLVVAVIDHEHVKLRLLYSRKKKLDKTVENLRNDVDELKVRGHTHAPRLDLCFALHKRVRNLLAHFCMYRYFYSS